MGLGGTEPFWAVLEDDTRVVFKTFNNLQGNKSLVNEYIGYRLAVELGLPIPDSGTAIMDEETTVPDHVKKMLDNPWHTYMGLGFYSVVVEKATNLTAPAVLNLVTNRSDIPKIVAFDVLIGNYDRNPGNLLIQLKKQNKKIHIIDHSHLFHIGCIWDETQLNRIASEKADINQLLDYNSYHYPMFKESYTYSYEEFIQICDFFNSVLTTTLIRDIIYTIPNKWSVSDGEKEALINFLTSRVCILKDSLYDFMKGGE